MKSSKYHPYIIAVTALLLSSFYPIEKGYFIFPIKPGERNFLAGNMSEIRPNHFHTGLDIKTDGRQGLPVYAAADGYIYRMKISAFGYGNILYLRHPNGLITAYAHLQRFAPPVAAFMREEMYREKQNELEVYLDEDTFPVKQGDIIAYSGNSGSSGGPHLHFEIRDSLDRAIDPLKFGFSEIIDNTPPTVLKVAVTPLEMDSRVNGKFERTEFSVNYDGESFYVNRPIETVGKVGIEVRAFDKLDDMYNTNGFPHFEIYEGDSALFAIDVDRVDFTLSRFLLSHTYRNSFTRLYKMPNNLFHFYRPDTAFSGGIETKAGEEREIKVLLRDVYGNRTALKLHFKGTTDSRQIKGFNLTAGGKAISYQNNIMVINGTPSDSGTLAGVYAHGYRIEIPMAYEGSNRRTYLWDLNLGIPDSIDLCNEMIHPEVIAKVPFQEQYWLTDGKISLNFEDDALLDDLFVKLSYEDRPEGMAVRVNDPTEYLRNGVEVSLDVSGYQGDKSRTHMYLEYENGYKRFLGGEWINGNIRFKTRNFGTFVLEEDSVPPRIRPIRINASEIRFSISDNRSGIESFEAYVDGEWLLMRYEYKTTEIWSERRGKEPLKGRLLLRVKDKANNLAIYERTI